MFRNTIVQYLEEINMAENNSHQSNSHSSRQPQTSTQILKSPLRSIIPKELGLNKIQNNVNKPHQTPNASKLLYALN